MREEIQILGRPSGQLVGDQRGTAGEEIPVGLGQREEQLRDHLLELGEDRTTQRLCPPCRGEGRFDDAGPGRSDCGRQDELVPEVDQ